MLFYRIDLEEIKGLQIDADSDDEQKKNYACKIVLAIK